MDWLLQNSFLFPWSSEQSNDPWLFYLCYFTQKSLLSDDIERDPLSSVMDVTDSSMKLPYSHPFVAPHHYNLSHPMFLKRSRHYYGHQYFRRKSVNYGSPSTSHGKGTPLRDERLSFKLANKCNSRNGYNAGDIFVFFLSVETLEGSVCSDAKYDRSRECDGWYPLPDPATKLSNWVWWFGNLYLARHDIRGCFL